MAPACPPPGSEFVPRSIPRSSDLEPVDVHRLGEDIFHDFLHQGMIGNLNVAHDIFLAGSHIGEHRRQQIIGPHALNLGRNFFAALKAQQRQRAIGIPAPAGSEDRRSQRRLLQNRLHRFGIQEMKNVSQRKAVLLGQRDVQSVVCSRGLQLKIEAAAKTLAQRQAPGLVDPCRR